MKHRTARRSVSMLTLTLLAFFLIFLAPQDVVAQPEEEVTKKTATAVASAEEITKLEQELREAETAFAAAFAEGDMKAFATFLHEHAMFMGRNVPLRGKSKIVESWTNMRGTEEPPFSWRPERVSVEAGGRLGMSTGPVLAPDGTWISSFVSTWEKTSSGWRVILDVGPKCPPAEPAPEE